MITLTLLHPIKNTPVQSWSFEHEPVIRMGRATDNHVVLYSAVVSRRHVELHRRESGWEIVNLGANGTFIDGERVNQLPASDGLIIRLARSGPSIQVGLDVYASASASSSKTPDSYSSLPSEPESNRGAADLAAASNHSNNGHGTIYDATPSPDPGFAHQTVINEDFDPFGYPSVSPSEATVQPSPSDPSYFGGEAQQPEPLYYAQQGEQIFNPAFPDVGAEVSPAEPTFESPSFSIPGNSAQGSADAFATVQVPYSTAEQDVAPPLNPFNVGVNYSAEPSAFAAEPSAQPQSPSFTPPAPQLGVSGADLASSQPASNANIISFSLETGQPLHVQQTIGRYQIVKTIVQSNNNVTYLAWRDGRSMALKTLNANWSDYEKASASLEEEARVFRGLRHPGLPQLIDFFWVDGQPFLAREMIYGKTLEQYVSTNGALSTTQALRWLVQICDVLSYLHQQTPALLHHDIKPRNIIHRATPQGSWEISLVGLQLSNNLTEAGTQMGFPSYTAPEQQEGRTVPSSDLYSLGPLLVYLLTGQEPELFYRYVSNEYRLVAEEVPGLIHPVAQLIHTLTELKPDLRYGSSKDVSRMIQQILNNLSSSGR